MDDMKAAEILRSLAAGSGPAEFAVPPEPPPLQSPDVLRALFLGAESLEQRSRNARRNSNLPRNAGKPWSQEEDARLLAAFDGGATVEALVATHERTRAGIEARLVKHGRLAEARANSARIR